MRKAAILTAVAGLMLLWAPSASAFNCGTVLDNFDRSTGTDLGPNWTEQAPDFSIELGRATNPAETDALMTYGPSTASEACADVTAGQDTSYIAIVLQYADLNNNVFIDVQNNDGAVTHDGTFDTAFLYIGNNGSTANLTPDQAALTPFATARIHVSVAGASATLDIDTNFDNVPERTITATGVPGFGLGTAIGLGAYGHALADRFATTDGTTPDQTAPDSVLGKHPGKRTTKHTAKFTFSSSEAGSTFQCKLDRKQFSPCSTPKKYRHLSAGKHKFQLQAIDASGNIDPTPAKFKWTVSAKRQKP